MTTANTAHSSLDGLVNSLVTDAKAWADALLPKLSELTPRQKEVLACIASGMSNEEIAGKLFVVKGTVKNCIVGIYSALNDANNAQGAKSPRKLVFLSVVYAAKTNGNSHPLPQESGAYDPEITPGQSRVLRLVGIGMGDKEIADCLKIKKLTVHGYTKQIIEWHNDTVDAGMINQRKF